MRAIKSYIFLIFLFCNSKRPENNEALYSYTPQKISGAVLQISEKVLNAKNNISMFYYHDSLADGSPVILNEHEIILPINSITFLIHADSMQKIYPIKPGDTILVDINQSGEYLFSNKNFPEKNELNFFEKIVDLTGNLHTVIPRSKLYNKANSIRDFGLKEKEIAALFFRRLAIIDSLSSTISDPGFITLAKDLVHDSALEDSLLLINNNLDLLNKFNLKENRILKIAKSADQSNFYPYFFHYKTLISVIKLLATGHIYAEDPPLSVLKNEYRISDTLFTGLNRDFLLSYFVKTFLTSFNQPLQKYFPSFFSDCKNENFKSLISKKKPIKSGLKLSPGEEIVLGYNSENHYKFDSLIAAHRGNIIYLDFWASWCYPCLIEMPFSKELEEKYKDKRVSFFYFSVDEFFDKWQKAFMSKKMNSKNSFLFYNPAKSQFLKKYKINLVIPRYMIIDKKGQIRYPDAPRPSDPKIQAIFESLLTEQ